MNTFLMSKGIKCAKSVVIKKHQNIDLKKIVNNNNQPNEMVDQLQKLNDLFKSGILTKEEFEKAKKKILN